MGKIITIWICIVTILDGRNERLMSDCDKHFPDWICCSFLCECNFDFLLFPNYLNITIVSSDVHYGFSLNLDQSCSASGQKSLVNNSKLLPYYRYSVAQEVWLFFFMIVKTLPCILSWATIFTEENVYDLFFYLQIFHMAPALDFPSQKLVACLHTSCSAYLILHDSVTPVLWGQ